MLVVQHPKIASSDKKVYIKPLPARAQSSFLPEAFEQSSSIRIRSFGWWECLSLFSHCYLGRGVAGGGGARTFGFVVGGWETPYTNTAVVVRVFDLQLQRAFGTKVRRVRVWVIKEVVLRKADGTSSKT